MRQAISTAVAATALLVVATATPVAAVPSTSPEATWGVDGPRVLDVIATDELTFLGGRFTTALPPVGTDGLPLPAASMVALDAVTSAPVWTGVVTSTSEPDATIWDLDLSGDGTILYLCGAFDAVGGVERANVAAVDAATGTVLPWSAGDVPPCRSIDEVDGTLVAAVGRSVRALSSDGTTGWRVPADGVTLSVAAAGPTLLVGGRFSDVAGVTTGPLARLDVTDGDVDAAWRPEPVPYRSGGEGEFVLDLEVDGSALYVAAGGADYAARFDLSSGRLRWWTDTSGSVQVLERLPSGALVVGGHFKWVADADTPDCGTNQDPDPGCASRLRLAALAPATGALLPWDPSVTGAYTGVWALDLDAAGTLHVGGGFTAIHGVQQPSYARLPAVATSA